MAGQLITGEALYQALLSANPDLAYTWRDLNTYDKDIYIEVATALNGTYLAPLQGLVRDYYDAALIGKQMEDPSEYDCRSYEDMMDALLKRTDVLLSEEQKG